MAADTPEARTAESLDELYRSWRILDLVGETVAQLPPEWLQILDVARNLILGSPLPGIDIPDELQRLVSPSKPEFTTVSHTEHRRRIVYPVTGDTTVQPLRNLSDFPNITMPDLLLRSLDEEMFDFRLLSDGINGVYNVEPGPSVEEWDELVEERVASGVSRKKRQRVYALLDVSNSMRDDNKIVFAKALMLAYLVVAAEEGSRVYFRTFANTVHPRSDCRTVDDFAEVAGRVLRATPDGSTDLAAAVAAAIGDINALDGVGAGLDPFSKSPTELLLVSDCESYSVPHIPRGIALHTVHLQGGYMMKGYREGFAQVRGASTTFTEIATKRFVLPQHTRERWLLAQDGRVLEPLTTAPGEDGPRRRAERTLRRKELLGVYERLDGAKPGTRGQKGPGGGHGFGRLSLFGGLAALAAAIVRLLHLRPRRARTTKPARPSRDAFGLQFRVRK